MIKGIRVESNPKNLSLDNVMRVEELSWPLEIRASREKFQKRYELFPQGFVVAYIDEKMVGVATSEIINYDPKKPPTSWYDITDNGWIEKTHNPKGNAMYGVSAGTYVDGVGYHLVQELIQVAKNLGLQYLVGGIRTPGYSKYEEKMSIDDYVKTDLDPDIKFFRRNGFEVNKIVKDYMFDDDESSGYGVVMHIKFF